MAITSGFFNSKGGDRKYNAEHMSRYFDKLITSGVFPNPSTQLQVVATTGMTVNVLPGRGIADCHWMENDANYSLTLDAADVVLDRIDAIVMKLDLTEDVRDVHLEVKKGTPSSSPTAPAMTRSDQIKEYCLATIRVAKLAESITQAQITDTRANTSVCGWVTGLITQVDTSTLFSQWQSAYEQYYDESTAEFKQYYESSTAAFDEWFQDLKETVATVTMVTTLRQRVNVEADNTASIAINLDYIQAVDVLNVYVNGFRLSTPDDYSVDLDGDGITLSKAVDAGTIVDFEVLKSIDGTGAESVLGDVQELKTRVTALENNKNIMHFGQSIQTSAWGSSAGSSGYYEATIAVDGVTENDMVDVNFDISSIANAQDAGVLNITTTQSGGFKLYAKNKPSTALTCNYIVFKGGAVS